jgi:hypothetical protein
VASIRIRADRRASSQSASTGSEFVLWEDTTAQFVLSAEQQGKLMGFFAAADDQTLKWGTTLIVGLAAVGGTLVYRGRRVGGYAFLGASGVTGVGANVLRRFLRRFQATFAEPFPADELTVQTEPETGALTLTRRLPGARHGSYTVKLQLGEFDAAEADAFITALAKVKK